MQRNKTSEVYTNTSQVCAVTSEFFGHYRYKLTLGIKHCHPTSQEVQETRQKDYTVALQAAFSNILQSIFYEQQMNISFTATTIIAALDNLKLTKFLHFRFLNYVIDLENI